METNAHGKILLIKYPTELGQTLKHTLELIRNIDPNDPDWEEKATLLLKRYLHYERLSFYIRISSTFESLKDVYLKWIGGKIKLHRKYFIKLTDEISGPPKIRKKYLKPDGTWSGNINEACKWNHLSIAENTADRVKGMVAEIDGDKYIVVRRTETGHRMLKEKINKAGIV